MTGGKLQSHAAHSLEAKMLKRIWHVWAKALGQKEGRTDKEADKIALIRTLIVLSYIITNCFIVAGVIRHW